MVDLSKGLKAIGNKWEDVTQLSLVPGLVITHKFQTPTFDKYDGTKCPTIHLTMYCRKMSAYTYNDKLLIYYFTPDRLSLQTMEKKYSESFRRLCPEMEDHGHSSTATHNRNRGHHVIFKYVARTILRKVDAYSNRELCQYG